MSPFLKIAYQPYKWIIAIPFVFIVTMVLSLVAIFTGLLFNPDAVNIIAVTWARLCCAIVPLKVVIKGTDNYNKAKSYVIVANHQSMADIPVIHGFLGLYIKWIMKKELEQIPIFGSACRQMGCIYVDRTNHGAALEAIETAKSKLSRKASVLFFAEGTRSRDGKVMPFKKGAFNFACETDTPILPITIKNSFQVLPSDSLDLTPGTIEIIVHPSVNFLTHHRDNLDERIENIRKTIASAL